MEGFKAYRQTDDLDAVLVPYRPGGSKWKAWVQGWYMAADKQREKDNDT